MKLSNLYWLIFEESGSIDAYLEYKNVNKNEEFFDNNFYED